MTYLLKNNKLLNIYKKYIQNGRNEKIIMKATLIQFLPLILILVVFYAILWMPEKKRKKQYDAMLAGLKVNDDVMTRGGIIGRIVSMDDDNIVLETSSDRTKIKFTKNAVSSKIYKDDEKKQVEKKNK